VGTCYLCLEGIVLGRRRVRLVSSARVPGALMHDLVIRGGLVVDGTGVCRHALPTSRSTVDRIVAVETSPNRAGE